MVHKMEDCSSIMGDYCLNGLVGLVAGCICAGVCPSDTPFSKSSAQVCIDHILTEQLI
jgi:hypothetical protein